MKLALKIIALLTVLSLLLFYSTMKKAPEEAADMPWHVTIHDARHSEVFGVVLNKTSLEQARQQFGQLDGIALFQNSEGLYNLEAYFGKLAMGPFSARLIANLDASQQELEKLAEHSVKRVKTEDGSYKWTLHDDKQMEQGVRKIKSLTYIPSYSGMDSDYLKSRFGEPAARQAVDETTELWLYPQLGVRIMLDNDGKEMFEYTSPADFKSFTGG